MESKMMDAVVFTETGKYEFTKKTEPEITKANEMKVKILAASICGTDVHILGNPPGVVATPGIILGHECVGEVVQIGVGVSSYQVGDRIILDNNLPCGVCPACQTGNSNLCTNMSSMGVHIDGVFAQYAVIPESAAVKISKDMSIDKAIFAEPLNCVMGGMKKLKVMPGDTVLILGGGPIGLYYTSMFKASGAGKVLVSEVSEFRIEHAIKNGADYVINPSKDNLKEKVLSLTNGKGADIVVDAVGVLLPDAIQTVCNGGSILLFGMNAQARQQISQNDITARGITIYGNFIGLNTLKNVANLLENDVVNFESMITHRLNLSEFETGLEAMRKGQALEVVLYPFGEM